MIAFLDAYYLWLLIPALLFTAYGFGQWVMKLLPFKWASRAFKIGRVAAESYEANKSATSLREADLTPLINAGKKEVVGFGQSFVIMACCFLFGGLFWLGFFIGAIINIVQYVQP